MFPKLATPSDSGGDSRTNFKRDLMEYLRAYRAKALEEWLEHIKQHDMSSARYGGLNT